MNMSANNSLEKIALVTDSTSDLNADIIKQYDIRVLPLRVCYKDKEYRDGVEITPEEVYAQMEREVPQTSLPSLEDIEQVFRQLQAEGFTHVIAVHISAAMSGTAQAVAVVARDFPDLQVEVVDSCMLALGLGMMVIGAAREIQKNTPFQEIARLVRERRKDLGGYYVLNTLEYLKKGGRINPAAASIGDFLNIKAVVSVNDSGSFYVYDKVRGREKSLRRLTEILHQNVERVAKSGKQASVSVFQGAAQEEALVIEQLARTMPEVKEVFTATLGPVMGVHTGPGLVGIGVMPYYWD